MDGAREEEPTATEGGRIKSQGLNPATKRCKLDFIYVELVPKRTAIGHCKHGLLQKHTWTHLTLTDIWYWNMRRIRDRYIIGPNAWHGSDFTCRII